MTAAPKRFAQATAEQKSRMFEWLRSIATQPATQWPLADHFYAGLAMHELARLQEPIPMLLFCPRCHGQHIDAPKLPDWTNPPHATHTCAFCGLLWRPSNRNTTGVLIIEALEPKHAERISATNPAWYGRPWTA